MVARDDPGVGAEPGRSLRPCRVVECREIDAGGMQGGGGRVRPGLRVVGMLGPEILKLCPVDPVGEARAQQLVPEVVAEVPGHELEPDQAVGGSPGLGLMPEKLKFQR